MAEQTGEKTELPTQRRLEDAIKRGQIPRSAEVQTVFVLLGSIAALTFSGHEAWSQLGNAAIQILGHLYDTPISSNSLQQYGVAGLLVILKCVGPLVIATMLSGLLAGAIQSRFQTASEVISLEWNRVNPLEGFKRLFSTSSTVATGLGMVKFIVVFSLTYSQMKSVLMDPIFSSAVSVDRLAAFLGQTAMAILLRISGALVVIAAVDYGYQYWHNAQELMMTRDELKEESKSSEANPAAKNARRRRKGNSKAKQLAEVAQADVVVTNPTHIAIALRYDRKTMKAPKVVAKGIRLNAQKIRELAAKHQVPIMENKPLARMLFKHARVGGEVPANLYAAVAEVLAWVYRVNRYRYFAEANKV